MTRQELITHCLGFADAYEDYPFDDGPDVPHATAALRHRGNQKTFAFFIWKDEWLLNLKCDPLTGEFLREQYPQIRPGFHMNKRHWITVAVDTDLPEDVLFGLIEDSWILTAPKAGKKRPGAGTL